MQTTREVTHMNLHLTQRRSKARCQEHINIQMMQPGLHLIEATVKVKQSHLTEYV
ncbi:hypothetical protein FLK61_25175 [Paenalkalicoccus suaedae]|uniref:Uncharacterized protein n=1 Tax=Paenalkalicoccus suaedae TaxID=2592382 RepID=A0A859FB78_9BACI|nr:hypothetical protein [Paenalkalicoccus suaedae]QKS70068.1 hypothetical protein FLK61_25175 [Paenalkalicoccus suaedae]